MSKRLFDFILSIIALIFLSPLIFLIALLVCFKMGYPPFFVQVRPGLGGRPFRMVKFRTMSNDCAPEGVLLPDNLRLNEFGRWLRSTSLDELPELWNVVRGDMSLVGPRPLLVEYLPLYTFEQSRRHNLRPGITGLAQVSGRNAIGWDERLALDVWYVDNHSFWLDLKILCLTLKRVLSRDGINAEGEATMNQFKGSYKDSK